MCANSFVCAENAQTSYPIDLLFRVFLPSSAGCVGTSEVFLPQALRSAGYWTGMVGKWHTGYGRATVCSWVGAG